MDVIWIIFLTAIISWTVDTSADAALTWVKERLRRDRSSNPPTQPPEQGQ